MAAAWIAWTRVCWRSGGGGGAGAGCAGCAAGNAGRRAGRRARNQDPLRSGSRANRGRDSRARSYLCWSCFRRGDCCDGRGSRGRAWRAPSSAAAA